LSNFSYIFRASKGVWKLKTCLPNGTTYFYAKTKTCKSENFIRRQQRLCETNPKQPFCPIDVFPDSNVQIWLLISSFFWFTIKRHFTLMFQLKLSFSILSEKQFFISKTRLARLYLRLWSGWNQMQLHGNVKCAHVGCPNSPSPSSSS